MILKRAVYLLLIYTFFSVCLKADLEAKSVDSLLKQIMSKIDCYCGCGMDLETCQREDSDCTTRPVIISRIEKLIQEGKTEEDIIRVFEGETTPAKKAMRQAKKENKFLVLFFYEKGSNSSDRMARIIKKAQTRWKNKSGFISIDINDSREKDLIYEYSIWQAPVTLVMAPNGVIITGFPGEVGLEDIKKAFISPKMIEIIGALQQKKVIFLSIQNKNTKYAIDNSTVTKNVADILGKSVKVVKIDPKDKREEELLKQININPDITNSVIMVVSQKGQIGDRFEGKVTKKELLLAFKKVLAQKSGCGTGGSGGCGG